MAITPNSSIYFCNVPWGSDYTHVCDASGMSSILAGTPLITTVSDYTYIRKDSIINVSKPMDDLIGANYVMYKNSSHENKWFYAFIESMEYKSDMATAVKIRTDVYQSWRDVLTLPSCFVAREHVSTDTIGLNTVPENLETGDFIFHAPDSTGYSRAFIGSLGIVIAVTETTADSGTTWDTASGNLYNGVFSGCKLYATNSAGAVNAFLSPYIEKGKTDSVVAIYMIPIEFLGTWSSTVTAITPASVCEVKSVTAPARPATINGYTPRNNKLLSFPYVHFTADNNAGGNAIFKYEDFQATPAFDIYGGVMPAPTYKCYPTNMVNSNGAGNGLEYGITIAGYPICAWSSDTFASWLGQNAVSIAGTAVGSVGAIIGGAVTGNPLIVAGGIGGVLSQVQALYQRSLAPDQAHGSLNAGSANIAKGWNDFYFHVKTIKAEYARIIDEFFDMYGYQVNRVKVPNLSGRANWNYIKTIDCIVKGGIPETDKQQLQKMFNNGVTIWHNYANIGDYSQSNAIT